MNAASVGILLVVMPCLVVGAVRIPLEEAMVVTDVSPSEKKTKIHKCYHAAQSNFPGKVMEYAHATA